MYTLFATHYFMYDTTSWTLDFPVHSNKNLENIAQYMDTVDSEIIKQNSLGDSYTTIKGYKDGYPVFVSPYRMNTYKYSIAKSCFESSVQNPTIKEVQRTIENLNDTWHQNISDATVNGLDIGLTVITSEKPSNYFVCFGDAARHTKSELKGSVYYHQKNSTINIYDKKLAMQSKKQVIPQHLIGEELLRGELRLRRGAKNLVSKGKFSLNQLYTSNFYNRCLDLLLGRYKLIHKLNYNMDKSIFTDSIKDYHKLGLTILINNYGGYDNLMKIIDAIEMDRIKKYRLKNHFRDAAKYKPKEMGNPLIKELDRLMINQVNELRA